MTTDHIEIETLSAFADGEVNAVAALRVERHVAECDSCRRSLERVRALVATAAALPREIPPPPEILAGVLRRVPSSASLVSKRWWQSPWLAAAAAIVIVAFGITQMVRSAIDSKAKLQREWAQKATVPVVLTSVDRTYGPALAQLREAYDAQRAALAPSTVRTMDHSLAVIDSAIADARDALAVDPNRGSLLEIVTTYYQRKIELLKRANSLSSL